ncbi:MAG: ABC transporter ATP-binding protein [Methanobacteriota archaeon]|nr:MAG: ABC transporter ATP-binding protein [Euryarchaeota archaeon]
MIEIERLVKEFGDIKAVDDLTIDVPAKRTVGFLGPNGAGKTTTIKILTNLIASTGGRALINGVDVMTAPKEALAHTGAVVETPEFYPYLTPVETLAYLGRLRGMSSSEINRRSNDVLAQVKMVEWKKTRIGKFSKGMKQRLAIAQALLHEPEVLILDEPTSGLDPRGMVEVREIIKGLKKQDYTIFMSSHLLGEVQEICDSAALINRGKLLVYDSIDNLKALTKTSKIEVTSAGEIPKSAFDRIGQLTDVSSVDAVNSHTMLVTFAGAVEARADLLLAIQGEGLKVTGFSPVGLPLEMMYMDLVKESR